MPNACLIIIIVTQVIIKLIKVINYPYLNDRTKYTHIYDMLIGRFKLCKKLHRLFLFSNSRGFRLIIQRFNIVQKNTTHNKSTRHLTISLFILHILTVARLIYGSGLWYSRE